MRTELRLEICSLEFSAISYRQIDIACLLFLRANKPVFTAPAVCSGLSNEIQC